MNITVLYDQLSLRNTQKYHQNKHYFSRSTSGIIDGSVWVLNSRILIDISKSLIM